MQPDAIDWAGIAQVAAVIIPLVLLFAFVAYQWRRRRQELAMEEAARQARYNRFLELLGDIKRRQISGG